MSEKKLKILGPYTPEHPGPFCTRDGKPARIICTDRIGEHTIIALVQDGGVEGVLPIGPDGVSALWHRDEDIMNAEEVPVAREFWVNEYVSGWGQLHGTHDEAVRQGQGSDHIRTIHVREVLPGGAE